MGIRITPSNDPAKPRLVVFFNPYNGESLGTIELPAAEAARTDVRNQEEDWLRFEG